MPYKEQAHGIGSLGRGEPADSLFTPDSDLGYVARLDSVHFRTFRTQRCRLRSRNQTR